MLTWQAREPYPDGGDELLIEGVIPRAGGRTAASRLVSARTRLVSMDFASSILTTGVH